MIAALPDWLAQICRPDVVGAALEQALELRVRSCEPLRPRLKKVGWTVAYRVSIDGRDDLLLRGRLYPPGSPEPRTDVYLPELRLAVRSAPAETDLPALHLLTDPDAARGQFERWLHTRLQACSPSVVRYVRGNRCTLRCALDYAPGYGGPAVVVAKVHRADEGRTAFEAMRGLWATPLGRGDRPRLAEPLAYDAELKVLVQTALPAERTLMDSLRAAGGGGPSADDQVRATAVGLAALHRSPVTWGSPITLESKLARLRSRIERLAVPLPDVALEIEALLHQIELFALQCVADSIGPTHGAFRPAQVLVQDDWVGFIDFDGFGLAEPALDVAEFRATVKGDGLKSVGAHGLPAIEALSEVFLTAYRTRAEVSERRLWVWDSLALLSNVLDDWTKVRPDRLAGDVLMLERHLAGSGAGVRLP